jgi:hypothetical protein
MTVHPIEMLRHVARSRGGDPGELGAEAAWSLSALAMEDPAAVLPACRRLLERHPSCGPLWWVSARVLVAGDPVAEAERCAGMLVEDPTADVLRAARRGEGGAGPRRIVRGGGVGEVAAAEAVLVEARAIGPGSMAVSTASRALFQAAEAAGTPLWVLSGVGRVLPQRLWAALEQRLSMDREGDSASVAIESLAGVARIIGPAGIRKPGDLPADSDGCPEPAELTARW